MCDNWVNESSWKSPLDILAPKISEHFKDKTNGLKNGHRAAVGLSRSLVGLRHRQWSFSRMKKNLLNEGKERNADSTQNLHIYHFKRFLSNYGSFKSFGSMEISKWCQFLKLYQTNGIMQRQQHRHRKIGLSLTIGQFLAWFLWKHSIIWPNFGISLIKLKSFYCTTFSRKKFEFPIDLQIC